MSDGKKLPRWSIVLYWETPEMPMHEGSWRIVRQPGGLRRKLLRILQGDDRSRLQLAPIIKARLEKEPLEATIHPGSRTTS